MKSRIEKGAIRSGVFVVVLLCLLASPSLFSEEKVESVKNLLSGVFCDLDKDGSPDSMRTEKAGLTKISYDQKTFFGTTGPSIKIDALESNGHSAFVMCNYLSLQPNKKYLFSIQLKVSEMTEKLVFEKLKPGIWLYIYTAKGKHKSMIIGGGKDSKGWMTALIPFDTITEKAFLKVRFLLHLNNVRAIVWIQNPTIIELSEDIEFNDNQLILADGETQRGHYVKF